MTITVFDVVSAVVVVSSFVVVSDGDVVGDVVGNVVGNVVWKVLGDSVIGARISTVPDVSSGKGSDPKVDEFDPPANALAV